MSSTSHRVSHLRLDLWIYLAIIFACCITRGAWGQPISSLRLSGVSFLDETSPTAIIEDSSSQKQEVFSVGDTVFGAGTLVGIKKSEVLLKVENGFLRLSLLGGTPSEFLKEAPLTRARDAQSSRGVSDPRKTPSNLEERGSSNFRKEKVSSPENGKVDKNKNFKEMTRLAVPPHYVDKKGFIERLGEKAERYPIPIKRSERVVLYFWKDLEPYFVSPEAFFGPLSGYRDTVSESSKIKGAEYLEMENSLLLLSAGLFPGDIIYQVNNTSVSSAADLKKIKISPQLQEVVINYIRSGYGYTMRIQKGDRNTR